MGRPGIVTIAGAEENLLCSTTHFHLLFYGPICWWWICSCFYGNIAPKNYSQTHILEPLLCSSKTRPPTDNKAVGIYWSCTPSSWQNNLISGINYLPEFTPKHPLRKYGFCFENTLLPKIHSNQFEWKFRCFRFDKHRKDPLPRNAFLLVLDSPMPNENRSGLGKLNLGRAQQD